MDKQVENALKAALEASETVTGKNFLEFGVQVFRAFDSDKDFMQKVKDLDETFDMMPAAEGLREVFFDLLLVNFFSADVKKLEEDYLESDEWEAIEEETIDRGTELLNVLLYLRECRDEDIEPDLADFLSEFLLVDDDEFQDEHRIYEDVIANQVLMESSQEEIARVAKLLPETSEFKDLFYPVMSFFYNNEPSEQDMEVYAANSDDREFDVPVYAVLAAFYEQ
jgi:hypothetical protein